MTTLRRSWKIPAAYAAVYLAWGSTYFAIRVAVTEFSPAAMAGARFLLSGLMMGAFWWWRFSRGKAMGAPPRELAAAAAFGCALLGGGTGFLAYAERTVPSGVAALIIGCSPILFAVFNALAGGPRLRSGQALGGLLSLGGLACLHGDPASFGTGGVPVRGLAALFVGMFCWVSSSVASKRLSLPKDYALAAAVEMLAAGVLMASWGLARGEFRLAELAGLSGRFWAAVVFLAVVGSCLGFTAYTYLLRREPANRVSSYAFVNPAVAVLLGVTLGGEPLTRGVVAALTLIVGGVSWSMWAARGMGGSDLH